MQSQPPTPQPEGDPPELKIYFLPNLLTGANLFCGFVALTKIVYTDPQDIESGDFKRIYTALAFILLAGIFDLFDGRVARMGGRESPFGREFDSLADLVSFGVAPAFLMHRVVLKDISETHPEIGWFIASIYLICGAFRLARFNCLAAMNGTGGGKEFLGFPIPSAAGMVASLTLLMIWFQEKNFSKGYLKFILPALMLFLSFMMVSNVKYPTFKTLDLKAKRSFTKTLIGVLSIGAVVVWPQYVLIFVLPAFFTSYLIYGFIRPRISHQMRKEIEEEDEDDSPTA